MEFGFTYELENFVHGFQHAFFSFRIIALAGAARQLSFSLKSLHIANSNGSFELFGVLRGIFVQGAIGGTSWPLPQLFS